LLNCISTEPASSERTILAETSIVPSVDPNKRILTIRQPYGVVAVTTTWNFPVAIPNECLSAALAAGNTVAWKPAPTSSIIAVRMVECFLKAGVPEGEVNLLFGEAEVGDEIVSNPGTHAVGLTGSSTVGNAVARRAGAKPTLLELGGIGPRPPERRRPGEGHRRNRLRLLLQRRPDLSVERTDPDSRQGP
jgi:acyl-CoA reductase-like NAD-dependent aldehyde dehydrogenase